MNRIRGLAFNSGITDPEGFLHAAIYDDDFLDSIKFDPAGEPEGRGQDYRFGSELGPLIPLVIYTRLFSPQSRFDKHYEMKASELTIPRFNGPQVGTPYVIKTKVTGSFVYAGLLPTDRGAAPYDVIVQNGDLLRPNELGIPPEPTGTMRIPRDSPRVLVGAGAPPDKANVVVLHEQYWKRSTSSYMLAPGQRKTVVFDQVSGVTEMSTDVKEISGTLTASASGGYGPLSASLSASLSMSSSSTQARTLQRQTTNSIEDVLVNESSEPVMIVLWELTDVFVITEAIDKKVMTIESAQAPPLVAVYPKTAKLGAPGVIVGQQK